MPVIKLDITTDGSGDGTATSVGIEGIIYKVQCIDGDFADGVDLTLTCSQGGINETILSVANFNSDLFYYPAVAQALNTDGSALTSYRAPMVSGRVTATIAQGGDTKSGSIVLYIF